MQFFLYEVAARVVAIYLCVDCFRTLRAGLTERKITFVNSNSDAISWVLDCFMPRPVYHRDTAPVRYWMEMSMQAFAFLACLVVAIFGWFQSNA